MFIPFGYSAAYGLIAGLMVYTALNGMIWLTKFISGGYIVPDDEDHREYWTSKFHHLPAFSQHLPTKYPSSILVANR
jgi:AGZA family xanthine/uracil permease-like MFS transporter